MLLRHKPSPVCCSGTICKQADFGSLFGWDCRLLPWLEPCSWGSGVPKSSVGMGGAQSHPLGRKSGGTVWARVRQVLTQRICFSHQRSQLFQLTKLILVWLFTWNDFHSLGVQEQVSVMEFPALCYAGVLCAVRP